MGFWNSLRPMLIFFHGSTIFLAAFDFHFRAVKSHGRMVLMPFISLSACYRGTPMLPCYKNTYCLAAALPLAIQTTTLMADTNLTGPSGGDSRTSLLAPYRTLKPQFSLPVTQSAEMNAQFDRGDIAWIYCRSCCLSNFPDSNGLLHGQPHLSSCG